MSVQVGKNPESRLRLDTDEAVLALIDTLMDRKLNRTWHDVIR